MNKLIVFNMISIDGLYAGPDGELDWHNTDEEFGQFATQQLDQIGTILFGRVTYQMMAEFWTTDDALKSDPETAQRMNSWSKIVFSTTLDKVDWNNTKLIKDNVVEEVNKLKAEDGKDLAIFGSGILVQNFLNLGLIDELRLMVNPVVLGKGKILFKDIKNRLNLKLIKTRQFKNGNVLLTYSVNEASVKQD